jgi:chromosome partitioning protein
VQLAGAEIELVGLADREYILKSILVDLKYNYDYILIDCPPSLNILTVNALTASDTVLVPIQCEYFALEGLSQLMYTIELIKKNLNRRLELEGVVFTMYDSRTNLSAEVVEEVKGHLEKNVYRSIIPRNVRLSEAPSHGVPITMYDTKSKGSEAYISLAQEVIAKAR